VEDVVTDVLTVVGAIVYTVMVCMYDIGSNVRSLVMRSMNHLKEDVNKNGKDGG
jgi:hypothetical protein